jgi:hypothetical protein
MINSNLITPSIRKGYYEVPPPAGFPEAAVLPHRLALTLALIINSGKGGISSLELINCGLQSVLNHVSVLRKKGAIIETQRRTAVDRNGYWHKGIAHYVFIGVK